MDSPGPPKLQYFSHFGTTPKAILGGVAAHFLLFGPGVVSKVMGDLNRAVIYPGTVAWVPAVSGGPTGFQALRYREGG
jgi:lipopolysaccharide export system permease protein